MGDDLEDDYVQGGDEYLSSGDDDNDDLALALAGGDPDVDGEGIVPESGSNSPLVAGGKRKAADVDDDDDGEASSDGGQTKGKELTEAERKKERKRRNKEKLKEKKKQRLNSSLLAAPGSSAATSFASALRNLRSSQRLALSKLSDLEWEDRELPESALLVLPQTDTPRTLVDLIRALPNPLPPPSTAPAQNGAPHVLVLAGSGQRCADLVRELRPLLGAAVAGVGGDEEEDAEGKKDTAKGKEGKKSKGGAKKAKVEAPPKPKSGEIAKLFAKHFKLSEHITYLHNTPISMAVGTPHRVSELLSAGALKTPPYILLDYTFRDAKQRGLLDNAECRTALFGGLLDPATAVWAGLTKAEGEEGRVKIGVF